MRRRKAIISLIASAIFLIVFTYISYQQAGTVLPADTPTPGFYQVVRGVDGDTIVVNMNGTNETIRFIGVDTPETHKPDTPTQCFGPQASDFTKNKVERQQVRLEADPTGDNRDRYDRLLRYVYLPDGELLQLSLIKQGYGFAYLSFPFQKKDEFAAAQTEAQNAKAGLWAACQPTLNGGRWQTNPL